MQFRNPSRKLESRPHPAGRLLWLGALVLCVLFWAVLAMLVLR